MKFIQTLLVGAALLGGLAMANAQEKNPIGGSFGGSIGGIPDFTTMFGGGDGGGASALAGIDRQAMIDLIAKVIVARVDTNSDGMISEGELAEAMKKMLERVDEELAKRFDEADSNGDGDLDFEEFSAISAVQSLADNDADKPAELFGKIDANGDGGVSREELRALLQQP